MKFGAFVPQGLRWDLPLDVPDTDHWAIMLSVARTIESSGFDSLWVYDHLQAYPPSDWAEAVHQTAKASSTLVRGEPETDTVQEPTREVTYEAWTLMAALAATTDTVRLGQMCTCNAYRPPSYLAKVAASVDVISNGRLEMGIGGGWDGAEREHDGYGYAFLAPAERLGMLEEGVEIMRALWTEDEVTYEGKHYNLRGAICQPRPVQKPHIPFWIAGGGEQITLRIAARYAAYTNFGRDVDEFRHKSEVLRGHCDDLGTDYNAIVRSINLSIVCGENEAEVDEKKAWLKGHLSEHISDDEARKTASLFDAMSGTPDQIVSRLKEWEAVGVGYAIVYFPDAAYDASSIEMFARDVKPQFN